MKHTHENKRIFSTFLLSYLSFLLAMFTCCLIFAGKISRQLLQETVLLKQNLVSSMEQNVENDLENLLEYTNGLAFDQELILAIQHPDVYSGSDVSHILANRGRLPNYIHDAFLYLPDTDKVVTASISMGAERFFSIIYQIGDLPAFHSACLESYQFRAFCQPVALRQYGSKQTMELLPFVQSLPISAFQSPAAQLVVLIDPSVLFAQASAAYTDDTDIYILNASDELIYDSQDALALNWQDIDWSQPVLRTDQGILVSCSGESGWHYAARIPGDLFLRQNRSTIRFLAVVFAAYLAIGAGLALWLSKRNYRPVRALKELAVSGGAVSGSNEYELIRHALQQHMQAGQDLSHILEQQRPVLLRDHLAALLRRQAMDIDTAQQELQQLGVEFETDQFLCAIVAFDPDSPLFSVTGTTMEENLAMAKLIVENVGCELLSSQFQCYKLDMFNNQSLFILCAKKNAAAQPDDYAAKQLEAVMQFAEQQFELRLICGVSQPETGLARWPMCFEEAGLALECAHFLPRGCAARFRLTAQAENDYVLPKEQMQQLALAVKTGDHAQAHAVIDALFRANFRDRLISRIAAESFLYQLTSALQQFAAAAGAPIPEAALQKILWCRSSVQAQQLLDACIDAFPQRQETATGRTKQLADRIAAYIDEHANDDWLDLSTLSQEFGVTPQYISNIFKKQRDENVKDYISQRKLARAKELLATTDLPVREIALRLGYTSEASIIRMFRKYEGITPGEYRLLHAGKQTEEP